MGREIAFVNPPTKYVVEPGVYPPVGLGYLAAAVNTNTVDNARVIDCAGDKTSDAVDRLLDFDVVGFTASSTYWGAMLEVARELKRLSPNTVIIAGGPHVTITRERDDCISSIFIGPSDQTIVDFLGDLDRGCCRPVYEGRALPPDMLPIPETPLGKNSNIGAGGLTAIIYSGFGCTHSCSFCAARAMYPEIRLRSVKHLMAEIDNYVARGVTEIRFMDDAFTMARSRAINICRELGRRGVSWGCMARVDQVDSVLLREMREGGCSEVAFGIESFDDVVLKAINKQVLASRNSEAIKLTHEAGLKVGIFVMTGTPGESKTTADTNVDLLEYHRERIAKILMQTFMPVPGCAVWQNPTEHGIRIVDPDYSKYNAHQFMRNSAGEIVPTPLWSPIRIDGLTEDQQYLNMQKMRDYVFATDYWRDKGWSK